MPNRFASGKYAISQCDRCGFRYKLKELKSLQLGMYPVDDPQAIRNPRPDTTYWQAGLTGIRTQPNTLPTEDVDAFGTPSGGSRVIHWGWDPVGFQNPLGLWGLPDTLVGNGQVGTVTIQTTEN